MLKHETSKETNEDSVVLNTQESESLGEEYEDTIEDISRKARQFIGKKPSVRMDELCKYVIRRIFKKERSKFTHFLLESTSLSCIKQANPTLLEDILVRYIENMYGMSTMKKEELRVAKSIFYNYIARKLDGKTEVSELVLKGTKKGAVELFSWQISRQAVYAQFKGVIEETAQICSSRMRQQLHMMLLDIDTTSMLLLPELVYS